MMNHTENYSDYIIIDGFAGGGGASTGIEMALGHDVDIAINHDPNAILMHKTNHPGTVHLTEDIFTVDLQKYTKGRHIGLMWMSPDCTQFSKAKGGKPRESGIRMLPWAVFEHAKKILPDCIIMENVEEIQCWGPLDQNGFPIKELEGTEYRRFITAMLSLGYEFDSRELVAADYGAPTTRKRWYAIFRRDGRPIIWPEPTHNKYGTDGKEPWVPVASVLDFSDLGKSIFGRKKPLAENTLRRIARGLRKFVIESPDPYMLHIDPKSESVQMPAMVQNNTGTCGYGIDAPLHTITTGQHHAVASVIATPFIDKAFGGNYAGAGSDIQSPSHTVTTVDHNRLITPYLIQYHSETAKSEVRGQEVTKPVQTIDTSNRYAEVAAFLLKFYRTTTGQSVMDPIHTITTSMGHFGKISVLTAKLDDLILAGVDEETAQKCTWVSEFMMEYYGCGIGQNIKEPLHTVVTKDRFALLTVLGNEYAIVDIRLRMLTPEELKLAQGFPKDYIIDRDYRWKTYPKAEQVARIGNSVVPVMAKALVEANVPYLKRGERTPNINTYVQESGQVAFA